MPTRRGFVTSMLGAGAALATQGPHKAARSSCFRHQLIGNERVPE